MAELNQAAEVVAEVAEQVADHAELVAKVSRALNQREISIMITSVAGGIICGFSTGYFIAKRRLEKKAQISIETEIAEMRQHYADRKEIDEEKPSLDEMAQRAKTVRHAERVIKAKADLSSLVDELGYQDETELRVVEGAIPVVPIQRKIVATQIPEKPVPDADQIIHDTREAAAIKQTNIWDASAAEDVWDYAEEIRKRSPETPYILHKDEYDQNEYEWVQTTLTYYEDDDVLADPADGVMDQDEVVGVENLGKFGHGSKDPNILYVRNERLQLDIEIVHSDGSYSQEVHGFVQHSDEPPRRRGRRHHDTE